MARVLVAMSGGVDSSVAAALTARAGHQAFGVTLRLTGKLETGFGCCGSARDVEDARRVCESVGIPHYVLDMQELFERSVIEPFVQGYLGRRTPNPCVECNRSVKFGQLLRLAEAWGADRLATGHYARAREGRLFKAVDARKDQSYFLCSLTRRQLERVLFPVGSLRKEEVRRLARELGLKTADKPESQEICFVPRRDYRGFVRSRAPQAPPRPGPIRGQDGRMLGEHAGLENYTVGQRRGLGVGAPEPLYVTGLDSAENTLWVGRDADTYGRALAAEQVAWTREAPPERDAVEARIRHRHAPAPARWSPLPDGRVRVDFDEPQRAITPGQAVVFYEGDEVLGGGTIAEAL